jgi:hypothetical protein
VKIGCSLKPETRNKQPVTGAMFFLLFSLTALWVYFILSTLKSITLITSKNNPRTIQVIIAGEVMKSYSTIVSGKEISKFMPLPDELKESELKVVIRPLRKKRDRFADLFLNPIKVEKIIIPSKDEIHEG